VDSIAANNLGGFEVFSTTGHAVSNLMLVRSTAMRNKSSGICACGGAGATLRVGNSAITGNATSWFQAPGGTVLSYGDNYIDGNGDGDPTPPATPTK